MIGAVGIVLIFLFVFGGHVFSGGNLNIIIEAAPHEIIIIGGAAVGAFVIGNDGAAIKHTLKDLGKVFKGPHWKSSDYVDLLVLLFELIRLSRSNPVGLEEHIEAPEESSIFQRYPKILADRGAVDLICDTLRSASMNYDDPHQVEEVLENRLEAARNQAMHPTHALQTVADGLPALGIVAAVLGVIKTMGSIDQPPEILGKLIASALVGTFLGVFLAYGLVGPSATRIAAVVETDQMFYGLIREVLVASLYNNATNICIEVGRQNTPRKLRPSFGELEDALKAAKLDAA